MKDDFLTLLVNETFNSHTVEKNESFNISFSPRKLCYSLRYNGKTLDFPNNWGVFSQLSSNNFQQISIQDELLLKSISKFLGIEIKKSEIKKTRTGLVLNILESYSLDKAA